jgi:uncharacterized OB-fold protein
VASSQVQVQHCGACGRWNWFPRPVCPSCFQRALEWRDAGGGGTIKTFTIVHRTHQPRYEPHVPIVLALVRLDEGCEMVTSLVGAKRYEARIGDRVRATAEDAWSTLVQFELEEQAA